MKMRRINLALFSAFLACLVSLPILCVDRFRSNEDNPWQLTPFNNDSLSVFYKENYRTFDSHTLMSDLTDSAKKTVMVLVDGWGVPYDEKMLLQDFELLKNDNAKFALHKRFLAYTSHAEGVEYSVGFKDGVLLALGDSAYCSEKLGLQNANFKQTICFVGNDDSRMVQAVDSLINEGAWNKIAWTVRSTREGNREKLHEVLRGLSDVASRHPDVQFIIQGTHRPILGTPETRRKYLAPWVPAVFINCELKKLSKK